MIFAIRQIPISFIFKIIHYQIYFVIKIRIIDKLTLSLVELQFYFRLSNFPNRMTIEVWLRPIFSAMYLILFPSR